MASEYPQQSAGRTTRNGVTLIELLVYMTILSIVTIGIMRLVTEVQQSNINTVNRADQNAAAELALRRIQVKLGNTDDVVAVDMAGTAKACLHMKSYSQSPRDGYHFEGRNNYIQTSGNSAELFNLFGASPRTISVWVRPENTMHGDRTVLVWGNGTMGAFGIELSGGQSSYGTNAARWAPSVRLTTNSGPGVTSCPSLDITDALPVTPNAWHHVAVTFDSSANGVVAPSSTAIFVDGRKMNTQIRQCTGSSVANRPIYTRSSRLYIGRSPGDRRSGFKGRISDIKVWSRALSSPEITQLYERRPEALKNVAGLYAHLPLNTVPSAPIRQAGVWPSNSPAEMATADPTKLLRRGFADSVNNHFFCFIDDDGDQLFALWESETAVSVPTQTGEAAANARSGTWTKQSDDIFANGPAGFFNVVGRDPESVIANIAVGKGFGGADDVTQKTASQTLATTRSKKRLELCAIESTGLAAPQQCSDTFKTAFVAIDGYIPGYHGKLDIQNAQWIQNGSTYRATLLPNLPCEVTAIWYPEHGVMKYTSTISQNNNVWRRAMAQTLYRPVGRSSDTTIKFNISLGWLGFFGDGDMRFYDFVFNSDVFQQDNSTNGGVSPSFLTYDRALAHADDNNTAYCGLQGYLVNIGSEEEQDHLRKVMMTGATEQWESGWIGARIDPSARYTFKWETGATDEQNRFWYGDGVNGMPYDALRNSLVSRNYRAFYEFDRSLNTTNRLQNLVQPTNRGVRFRYTNWAAGKGIQTCDPTRGRVPSSGLCEPRSSNSGDAAAIYGHNNNDGTWFSVRNRQYTCDANNEHSICGYYIELQSPPNAAPLNFGQQVTRDMARFREFCETSDNITY